MNSTGLHPLAEVYLDRLESAARVLPRQERAELTTELRSHLDAGLPDGATDAQVRNLLDDLGAPESIVAAARDESADAPAGDPVDRTGTGSARPPSPWGAAEVVAVLGLTLGAFIVPIVGPLVGICFAWGSPRWTRREKYVATALALLPLIALALGAATFVAGSAGSGGSVPVNPVPASTQGGAR
jgi:hypothetical protein